MDVEETASEASSGAEECLREVDQNIALEIELERLVSSQNMPLRRSRDAPDVWNAPEDLPTSHPDHIPSLAASVALDDSLDDQLTGHPSLSEAVRFINTLAHPLGFEVVNSSGSERSGRAIFSCHRRGTHCDQRVDSTRSTRCRFRVSLTSKFNASTGKKLWSARIQHDAHNHGPSSQLYLRKQTTSVLDAIKPQLQEQVLAVGLKGRALQKWLLRRGVDLPIRRVNNIATDIRKAVCTHPTAAEAALELMERPGFITSSSYNAVDKRLDSFFLSTETARALVIKYPSVLTMDATYKTNRFGLACIQICGATGFGKTFTAALAFVPKENKDWYRRALEWFKESILLLPDRVKVIVTDRDKSLKVMVPLLFPAAQHHLCEFHILNNIRSKSQGLEKKELRAYLAAWRQSVLEASSVEQLESGIVEVVQQFPQQKYRAMNAYLPSLVEVYPQLCYLYVDQHPNKGYHTTSPNESAHQRLKAFLRVANLSLDNLVRVVRDFYDTEWADFVHMCNDESERRCTGKNLLAQASSSVTKYARRLMMPHLVEAEAYVKAFREYQAVLERPDVVDHVEPKRPEKTAFSIMHGLPDTHAFIDALLNDTAGFELKFNPEYSIPTVDDMLKVIDACKQWDLDESASASAFPLPRVVLDPWERADQRRRRGVAETTEADKRSTRRLPSQHEYVRGAEGDYKKPRAPKRCRECRNLGHDQRTCPQKKKRLAAEKDQQEADDNEYWLETFLDYPID